MPSLSHGEINLQKTCNEEHVRSTVPDSTAAFSRQRCMLTQSPVGINQKDNFMKRMTKLPGLTCKTVLFIKHKVRVNIYMVHPKLPPVANG